MMTDFQKTAVLIKGALEKMTPEERSDILAYADAIVFNIKKKHPLINFSRLNALELLMKIGIFEQLRRLPEYKRNKIIELARLYNNGGKYE